MIYFPKKYSWNITQIKKLYRQGTALLTVIDGFATGSEDFQNYRIFCQKYSGITPPYISICLEKTGIWWYIHAYIQIIQLCRYLPLLTNS